MRDNAKEEIFYEKVWYKSSSGSYGRDHGCSARRLRKQFFRQHNSSGFRFDDHDGGFRIHDNVGKQCQQ